MNDTPVSLAVVVLTYNEEINLRACLASLRPLNCPVFCVDSGSTDATAEIARDFGATIVPHAFETHAKQWLWSLENLPLSSPWVLGLDADQSLTPELAAEIAALFSPEQKTRRESHDGFYLNRRHIFRGRWIRHGGCYPKYLLKLFRRDRVHFDPSDLLDHHFHVPGPTASLRHDLIEENRKERDLGFWIDKHNKYATLLAREQLERARVNTSPIQPSLFGSPDQRILWLKNIWWRMPLYWRPLIYFVYRYFLALGWLDGKQGFLFHFLHGYWFRLLVDVKLDDLKQSGARH